MPKDNIDLGALRGEAESERKGSGSSETSNDPKVPFNLSMRKSEKKKLKQLALGADQNASEYVVDKLGLDR